MPIQFLQSVLFAWFYLSAVLGFTFLFSSLFKSSTISRIVTAIQFLFAFSLIQTLVTNLVEIEQWFILAYGAQIIGNILSVPCQEHKVVTSFGPPDDSGLGRLILTTFNVQFPEGLVIIGIYFIVTAILGLIIFERKEFTGWFVINRIIIC